MKRKSKVQKVKEARELFFFQKISESCAESKELRFKAVVPWKVAMKAARQAASGRSFKYPFFSVKVVELDNDKAEIELVGAPISWFIANGFAL